MMKRPELLRWLRLIAPLTVLLILIQAIFAGRGLFISADELDLHGMIGNLTFLVAIVQLVLVVLVGFSGRLGRQLLVMNAVMVVLLVAQLGLGYSGRDSSTAAAIHVPTGVFIFGLGGAIAMLLSMLPSADREAPTMHAER
jgi:hypothetical protein